ncbi:MAG: hypothetical protein WCF85_20785, partial [Rhodospirillaceae bacterium]
ARAMPQFRHPLGVAVRSTVPGFVGHHRQLQETAAKAANSGSVDKGGGPPHDGGMDDAWRNKVDGRLDGLEHRMDGLDNRMDGLDNRMERLDDRMGGLEKELHSVKGTIDGMKIAFAAVFAVLTLMSGFMWRLDGRVSALSDRMTEEFRVVRSELTQEFRAQRAEMSAQTAAIASAFSATKLQPPQVILMPAPTQPTAPAAR